MVKKRKNTTWPGLEMVWDVKVILKAQRNLSSAAKGWEWTKGDMPGLSYNHKSAYTDGRRAVTLHTFALGNSSSTATGIMCILAITKSGFDQGTITKGHNPPK